jgi:hypothetical protein
MINILLKVSIESAAPHFDFNICISPYTLPVGFSTRNQYTINLKRNQGVSFIQCSFKNKNSNSAHCLPDRTAIF